MAHKFFNTNIDKEEDLEESSEYSDHILVAPSKARDEYIDRSNPITKIFLIGLGLFCLVGVLYYIVQWLSSK